jgi:hypothetical protein
MRADSIGMRLAIPLASEPGMHAHRSKFHVGRIQMKSARVKIFVLTLILCVVAAGMVVAQDKTVPKSLVKFAQDTLALYGQDAQLVAFVATSNASPQALDKLKSLDARWQKKDNIEDFVKALLGNAVSKRLAAVIGAHAFVPEAFIMDAQGTIIGETNRTSTYWKGEQTKFTEAYAGGKGAIWYGTLAYDESTKTNSVQISVPVVKGGAAIGVICFTVNVDEWEKR